MLSSCRNGRAGGRLAIGLSGGLVAFGAAQAVRAQETYFVPEVSASAEYNTNRQLDSTQDQGSAGYRATVEGYLKRNTQLTKFFLHPQLSFQKYPNIPKLESVEGMVEAEGTHRTVRGNYSFVGRYTRQDTLNAEIGRAAFDTVDPNAPDTQGTGVAQGGITRTRYELEPGFSYSVTELVDIEGDLRMDSVKYESDLPGERVGYDAPSVSLTLVRAFGPRLKLGIGPYYSRYESDNNANKTNAYGADFDFRYEWSQITRTNLVLSFEKDDITENGRSDSATAVGVRWLGRKRNRVGELRYSIGRFLQPSSVGTRATLDQFRAQWVRPMSPRLTFDVAARYTRVRSIGNSADDVGRDRANVDVLVRTLLTETISLAGGYRFAFLDRVTTSGSVENHGVFLTVAFIGRDPNPEQR
jgi:hypothetical protein